MMVDGLRLALCCCTTTPIEFELKIGGEMPLCNCAASSHGCGDVICAFSLLANANATNYSIVKKMSCTTGKCHRLHIFCMQSITEIKTQLHNQSAVHVAYGHAYRPRANDTLSRFFMNLCCSAERVWPLAHRLA